MHVICKKCGNQISVSHRPKGSTNVKNAHLGPNTNVSGGQISFGPGGGISLGPGGSISFGPPPASQFVCVDCGHTDNYGADEIQE